MALVDPLEDERVAAEAALAEELYTYWGAQQTRVLAALRAERAALAAAQAEHQSSKEVTLDWQAEELLLTAQIGELLAQIVQGALAATAVAGVGVSWEVYDTQAAALAQQYGYDLIKQITDSTRLQLGKLIGHWIGTNADFGELVAEVRKLIPTNPFPSVRDRAQLIAATEVTRIYADARAANFTAAGLRQWVWRTAMDELVCFPAGTAIATVDGSMAIESIRPGTCVLTRHGPRRVIATLQREYLGLMITIHTTRGDVTATADHPFWTLEQGWLEGVYLQSGHHLQAVNNEPVEVLSVKNFVFCKPADAPTVGFETGCLAGVPFGITMPVNTIHLDGNALLWKQEVNAIAGDLSLLNEFDAQHSECLTDNGLNGCLTIVPAVAGKRTECTVGVAGQNTKTTPALSAGDINRRAAAFLGAVMPVVAPFGIEKHFPTPFACGICARSQAALTTTDRVAVGLFDIDGKCSAADRADFGDDIGCARFVVARTATKCPITRRGRLEMLHAADRACDLCATPRPSVVAGVRAKMPFALSFLWPSERDAALVASVGVGHESSPLIGFPELYHELQVSATPVYNLEVEGQQEFYANGVLVHNCPVCRPLGLANDGEGAVGTIAGGFQVPETGQIVSRPPAHPGCRCWVVESVAELETLVAQQPEEVAARPPDDAEAERQFATQVHNLRREAIMPVSKLMAQIAAAWGRPINADIDIVLTGERRDHILARHPELAAYLGQLLGLISNPDEVQRNKHDPDMAIFYKRLTGEHYLRAAVLLQRAGSRRQHSIISARLAYSGEVERGRQRRVWAKGKPPGGTATPT